MNSSVAELRPRERVLVPTSAQASGRSVRRRVGLVWGLLVLNALTYYGSALHIPHAAGRVITQAALPAALIVALSVNRRVVVRPNDVFNGRPGVPCDDERSGLGYKTRIHDEWFTNANLCAMGVFEKFVQSLSDVLELLWV